MSPMTIANVPFSSRLRTPKTKLLESVRRITCVIALEGTSNGTEVEVLAEGHPLVEPPRRRVLQV
jgi:hypothetical protein